MARAIEEQESGMYYYNYKIDLRILLLWRERRRKKLNDKLGSLLGGSAGNLLDGVVSQLFSVCAYPCTPTHSHDKNVAHANCIFSEHSLHQFMCTLCSKCTWIDVSRKPKYLRYRQHFDNMKFVLRDVIFPYLVSENFFIIYSTHEISCRQ